MATSYNNLGSDPNDVLVEPRSAVSDLRESFGTTIQDVKNTTNQALWDAEISLDDAREEIVEKMSNIQEDNQKTTEDINDHIQTVNVANVKGIIIGVV